MEYKVLCLFIPVDEHKLNQMGADGWKLVSVVKYSTTYYTYFIKE